MRVADYGVPQDRQGCLLLRNELTVLAGLDPFTVGVLVCEVTFGGAPPDRPLRLGL